MKKFGFKKHCRLQTGAEFQAVFSQPIRSGSRLFTVLARANARENARLGLVIARRYVKRAVDRNRIRRIIRERFRLQQEKLKGLDLVVIVRSNVLQEINPFTLLERQWDEVLQKWKRH